MREAVSKRGRPRGQMPPGLRNTGKRGVKMNGMLGDHAGVNLSESRGSESDRGATEWRGMKLQRGRDLIREMESL